MTEQTSREKALASSKFDQMDTVAVVYALLDVADAIREHSRGEYGPVQCPNCKFPLEKE